MEIYIIDIKRGERTRMMSTNHLPQVGHVIVHNHLNRTVSRVVHIAEDYVNKKIRINRIHIYVD